MEMDYCEDADLAATNSVEDAVGKVPRDCVADIAVKNLILLGVRLDPLQRCVDFRDELLAETLPLLFIPFCCTSDVSFGATPNE